ncbi:MAG: hypothetical protein ABJB86_09145 [Bacteroidota bacterium]
MIRSLAVLLVVFLFFTACKKSSSDSTTTIEYQVITTNSSSIEINYTNAAGTKTVADANSSWTFDVVNPQKPFSASIQASSKSPFSSVTTTCTVNILVNGSTVKTATVSSNTVAVAEADYTVQ